MEKSVSYADHPGILISARGPLGPRDDIGRGISHPIFYGNILYKAQKCQYSPQKLTKPLNRPIKKGYIYDTVVRLLKIAYFGVNIESDSLLGSLHRN